MLTIEQLAGQLAAFEARLVAVETNRIAPVEETLAVDIDDPKYGDPVVRKNPPRWTGEDFAGRPYSQCTPEFLDSLAGFLLWRAKKEEAEPEKAKYARYSRLDAARARAWIKRMGEVATSASRYGTSGAGASAKHTGTPDPAPFSEEDEIPF